MCEHKTEWDCIKQNNACKLLYNNVCGKHNANIHKNEKESKIAQHFPWPRVLTRNVRQAKSHIFVSVNIEMVKQLLFSQCMRI